MCVLQDGISKVLPTWILWDDPSPTSTIHAFVREDGLKERKYRRKTYSWLVDNIITWGSFVKENCTNNSTIVLLFFFINLFNQGQA